MSGFSPEWLALRESADARARSNLASTCLAPAFAGRHAITALDLGCGTGSNVRWLRRMLAGRIEWRLVDNDPRLLAIAKNELGDAADIVEADLQRLEARWFDGIDLVTASALLDLVSEEWLTRLTSLCAGRARAVLFVLNYDGRIEAQPRDDDDEWVRELVNLHQRTDKGFGPALGPSSGERCAAALERVGYEVCSARSDWCLQNDSRALQHELIQGWASAASEIAPWAVSRVRAWEERRLAHVANGCSILVVGHLDVAGRRRDDWRLK